MLVSRSAREHGGVAVKWLGDGVMVYFPLLGERRLEGFAGPVRLLEARRV